MSVVDSLKQIQHTWITRLSHRLARGEGVRESFQDQLNVFFNLIVQSIETGDPSWLDSLLEDWLQSSTQSDLKNGISVLRPILAQILEQTYEIVNEALDTNSAMDLIGETIPVFTHGFEFVARRETELAVQLIQNETEEARMLVEQLEKSKSDFIAIAAHELKTPLTLIDGYTDMLSDQIKIMDGSQQVEMFIIGIKNGNDRLREIIDDMIDVSLIDNNLLTLRFQPYWINRLISNLVIAFEEKVSTRHQQLEAHPIPGGDEMIFGDEERLFQAMGNLLENAIKYTPDGGKIVIDGRELPGFLEITITDTGIGIDPEDHSRIFKKFGQTGNVSLHSSGKTKFKGGGPGLGLPISKGIIESHGGTIWVESEGQSETMCPGSIFHVLIPMLKEPPDDKISKLFASGADSPIFTKPLMPY